MVRSRARAISIFFWEKRQDFVLCDEREYNSCEMIDSHRGK